MISSRFLSAALRSLIGFPRSSWTTLCTIFPYTFHRSSTPGGLLFGTNLLCGISSSLVLCTGPWSLSRDIFVLHFQRRFKVKRSHGCHVSGPPVSEPRERVRVLHCPLRVTGIPIFG